MRSIVLVWAGLSAAIPLTAGAAAPEALSFEQVLDSVARGHPGLAAARNALAARDAAVDQAGTRPNPELSLEVEDAAGTGAYRGLDAAQSTVQISQAFEGVGKAVRRKQVAAGERQVAEAEAGARAADLRAQARARFLEALAAQARVELAQEAQALAESLALEVTRRVRQGASSQADGIRTGLAAREAGLETRKSRILAAAAGNRLGLLWGNPAAAIGVRGDLAALDSLPTLDALDRALSAGPEMEFRFRSARLAEAKAAEQAGIAKPDFTVSAGYRRHHGSGDGAWVGGVSLPLPAWNRNRGGRESARQEALRAQGEAQEALIGLKDAAMEVRRDLASLREEIEELENHLIPDGLKASNVLLDGYRNGRFGLQEVLAAEGDSYRHRIRCLDALLQYQVRKADWDRLMGTGMTMRGGNTP